MVGKIGRKKMRLIDANKLREDVIDLPNCYNGFSDNYDKAMIIDLIDEQPTVEAISKEWIRKYTNHRTVEFGDMWVFINCMINDWEKENEID